MEPKIYFTDSHQIDNSLIDSHALSIIETLRRAGYTAYLVGGGVRDILLKRKPKDFDISTSALPEEIKALFRRSCILIGRRFRLAHIRVGHKIFEVSTFRAGNIEESELIVRDNQWGTAEEDAFRRDFSINGLLYDPHDGKLIDYVNGWEDLQKHTLRSIGNPELRFKQDPVRMIRLLKFHARFGFTMHEDCITALQCCREEIMKSAPARVQEEFLRMLESGHACKFLHLLSEHQLLSLLMPELDRHLKEPQGEKMLSYLHTADLVHHKNEALVLPRPLLLACLLFPLVEETLQKNYLSQEKIPHFGEISILVGSVIREMMSDAFTHFPKKITIACAYILSTQYRLTPLVKKRQQRFRFVHDHDFPLALRFLKLRALLDETLRDIYYDWDKMYRSAREKAPPRHSVRGRTHAKKP